jgi:hypothetical protein
VVAAGVTSQEVRYCYGCLRVSYVAGVGCDRCNRLRDQLAESARQAEEWRQRFPTAEALQAYQAEQEQRQQVYRAGQEQLRLKRRQQRRRVWRWVPVIVAAYMAVLLIVTALR